ncbi:exported hypothetical protein [Syntrophobacter sp. SbD2]|nr:exported hypothetical protein [Syntrophobacter sp. SbD2]
MIGKTMTIAVLAVFLMTSPCWAWGGGAGGGAVATSVPIDYLMPGPPRNVTATADNGMVTVSFDPPKSDGGSPVTVYTVTSHPGGIRVKSTKSPIIVKGLTNGKAYTFTVTAGNSVGIGLASGSCNSVTPMGD